MTAGAHGPRGVGLALRAAHVAHVLAARPPLGWLEILAENYLVDGGRPLANLDRLAERYPVVPRLRGPASVTP